MSALSPLYLLGLLAVAAPIVFHLIRRSPRGEVPFSSLLFLAPSPPRLTRRSRLDNLLLLILRASALCLLAVAFARPFLRQEALGNLGEDPQRRVAVLIDTSASLRRGDLWTQAKAIAGRVIAECQPAEELAVFAFDTTTRPVLDFAESAKLDPARRRTVAMARLDRLEPTWAATNLGQALVDAVAAIEDVADTREKTGRMPRRIVLISDLQQGSRLDALGELEWPKDAELDVKKVPAGSGSNAGLHRLDHSGEPGSTGAAGDRRVRVFNDAGSNRERFTVRWTGATGSAIGEPIDAYVPPGESRVLRVSRPPPSTPTHALVLTGDAQPFDNTLYLVEEKKDEATVLFVGPDKPDDPNGLLYYLLRVFPESARRSVRIDARQPAAALAIESDHRPPLLIVAAETSREKALQLRKYIEAGGTLVYVAARPGRAETLATLADVAPRALLEAAIPRDVMLGEIAFDHPVFAPFAGAQYSDFTKIHFWKYRRLDPAALGEVRVLARFENGDAAFVEKSIGKGSLFVLASGWNPADSQLARSSKFVPLMSALLDHRDPRAFDAESHTVGDRVALPAMGGDGKALVVHKPSGDRVALPAGSTSFDATDEPGVYTIETPAAARSFAVNLDPAESKTSPLAVETLEQYGCRLSKPSRAHVDRERLRQMHNAELEGRQKLWRWLILAAIGVLIVETWLAGRLNIKRPRLAHAEALAT
ncbi:MAG TPA: BatA domain-containing protein [Isosphaeraceae bacterium]|nr:BatA domain-containing protein [Isosphaeraceae bacterium]